MLKQMPSKARQKKLESDLAKIVELMNVGQYAIANGGLYSVLKEHPFWVEALKYQSLLYAIVGDFPEALASAVLMTNIEPERGEHWKLRGQLEIELGFNYSANRSLGMAKELGSDDSIIKALGGADVNDLIQKARDLPPMYGWNASGVCGPRVY